MVDITGKHRERRQHGRVGPAGIRGKSEGKCVLRGHLRYGQICGAGAYVVDFSHWMKISHILRSPLWGHLKCLTFAWKVTMGGEKGKLARAVGSVRWMVRISLADRKSTEVRIAEEQVLMGDGAMQ